MAYRYTRDKLAPGVYHIYNRARDGLWMFRDDEDRRYFEYLIDRHLSLEPRFDRRGRPYVWLRNEVSMHARNLLSTHFHLVLRQHVPGGIDQLMTPVLSIYSRYYNRKYGTSKYLYVGEYRARRIASRSLFRWIIGYVHANNSKEGLDWKWSTHRGYLDETLSPDALSVGPALKAFGGLPGYLKYMEKREVRERLDAELRYGETLF